MSDRGSSALSPHYTVLSSSLLRQFLNSDRTPVPVILNEFVDFVSCAREGWPTEFAGAGAPFTEPSRREGTCTALRLRRSPQARSRRTSSNKSSCRMPV